MSLLVQEYVVVCLVLCYWVFFTYFGERLMYFYFPFVCSKLFTEFILNVPMSRLTIQKLYCLIEIVHSDLFTQHGKQDLCNH